MKNDLFRKAYYSFPEKLLKKKALIYHQSLRN